MSNSLKLHELQHSRFPSPSLSLEFAQIHVHWVSDAIQSSHLLLPNECALCIRWPNYWSFSFRWNFSISPSNEYLGLISFRIDWFDLLAVQGTLKSPCGCHVGSIWLNLSENSWQQRLGWAFLVGSSTICMVPNISTRKVTLVQTPWKGQWNMIQQSHFWMYIQRNWTQVLTKISEDPYCVLSHFSRVQLFVINSCI